MTASRQRTKELLKERELRESAVKLARLFVPGLLEAAIESGEIDPTGKSYEELRLLFADYLKAFASQPPGAEIMVVEDHRSRLLAEARRCATTGD